MAQALLVGGLSAGTSLLSSGAQTAADFYSTNKQFEASNNATIGGIFSTYVGTAGNIYAQRLGADLQVRNAALAPVASYHSLVAMGADKEFAVAHSTGRAYSSGGVVRNFVAAGDGRPVARNINRANFSLYGPVTSTIENLPPTPAPPSTPDYYRNPGSLVSSSRPTGSTIVSSSRPGSTTSSLSWDYGSYGRPSSSASTAIMGSGDRMPHWNSTTSSGSTFTPGPKRPGIPPGWRQNFERYNGSISSGSGSSVSTWV